jgi:hypothetical protein
MHAKSALFMRRTVVSTDTCGDVNTANAVGADDTFAFNAWRWHRRGCCSALDERAPAAAWGRLASIRIH